MSLNDEDVISLYYLLADTLFVLDLANEEDAIGVQSLYINYLYKIGAL